MSNRTYRLTEIVGTSTDGVDDAIRNGVSRAGQTIRQNFFARGRFQLLTALDQVLEQFWGVFAGLLVAVHGLIEGSAVGAKPG